MSSCWEKLQCNGKCDLSHGIFQYADALANSDQNCGCSETSDCKTNLKPDTQVTTYVYKGATTGTLINYSIYVHP